MSLNVAAVLTIGAGLASSFLPTVGRAQERLGEVGKALERIKERQQALNDVIRNHNRQPRGGSALSVGLAYQELDALDKQTSALKKHQGALEAAQQRREQGRSEIVRALTIGGAAQQALLAMTGPIRAAISFETAMLGVAKQVPGARDENGKLTHVYKDMVANVHKLGRELPIATNEIAEMFAAGARMGVHKDELKGFVRLAGMMSSAFEMPAGDLAEQMGKVAKVYGIPIPRIGELADAINYLDDNAISKGGDIINVLQRIGGTAAMLGMSAKDAAALGSTFLTLGASAEVAATASNAVMRELSTAATQGKKFKQALGKDGLNLGMTPEQLQEAMAKDATGTIMKVLEALEKLPKEKRLSIATLLFGKEYGDDVAKLAVGRKEYQRQVELANSKEAQGSMSREHEARMGAVGAQWEVMKNQMTEISVAIGSHLLPALGALMVAFGELLGGVADFIKDNGALVDAIVLVGGGFMTLMVTLRAYRLVAGAAAYTSGAFRQSIASMRTSLVGLPGEASTATSAIGRLGKALRSPGGLVALGLWGGLFYLIHRNWDSILQFVQGKFPALGEQLEKVAGWFSGAGDSVLGVGWSVMASLPLLGAPISTLGVVSTKLQTLTGKFVSLGKLVMAHPLLVAVGLLATAAYLVYRNWEPLKQFFGDLWEGVTERFNAFRAWLAPWVDAGVMLFQSLKDQVSAVFEWISQQIVAVMGQIQKASSWVEEKTAPAQNAYWGARGKLTDAFEWIGHKWNGTEPVRADAPVETRRLPALPAPASRTAGVSQQNTVTINVTQQPGEDGAALARRIQAEQSRALQVRERGSMFDMPAMAY